MLTYLESLQESRKTVSGVLGAVNSALDELQSLESNYHFVSNKTNALHNSCRQLIQEQVSNICCFVIIYNAKYIT